MTRSLTLAGAHALDGRLVPSVNLPDFITSARRELMFSCDFFCGTRKAERC